MRANYGRIALSDLRRRLRRTGKAIYNRAVMLGLQQPRSLISADDRDAIRRMNSEGATDPEIAAALGRSRKGVMRHRRAMELPSNAYNERHRDRIRQATQRWLQRAGLSSTGEIRREAFRRYARDNGWPEDLRPRAVQILNLMASSGVPLSRRQIARGVGMPWKGTRHTLASNDPEGSYLAHLCARRLVQLLPRALKVTGQGRGRSCHLYCLAPLALSILAARAREIDHAHT